MDKKAIVEAISNPDLVRRAITVLSSDPGPLEMVEEGATKEMAYRLYRHNRGYLIASECGHMVPAAAVIDSASRATTLIDRQNVLDDETTVSCLAIVQDNCLDTYRASRFPIILEEVQSDGSCTSQKLEATMGWYALVLGYDVQSLDEVICDLEEPQFVD